MAASDFAGLAILIILLAIFAPLLGRYIAAVFADAGPKGPRVVARFESRLFSLARIDEHSEQTWRAYAISLLAFSSVSVLFLYALERLQSYLPGDPLKLGGLPPALAINTAVWFVTNTNWQNYSGESTMAMATQMIGLAVQNFASAAVGIVVAIALVRGLARSRSRTIGNFWVDLTRTTTRILLPLAVLFTLFFTSQGVVDNLTAATCVNTIAHARQCIPGGPVSTQEAIKLLGTNGGGYFGANSAHPFENPTSLSNFVEIFALLLIPFSLPFTFGRMIKSRRQGLAIFFAMFILWAASASATMYFETNVAPLNHNAGVAVATKAGGGNLEGTDLRIDPAACALFAASTTGTSTGATACSHDSLAPAAGGVALFNMMLGEVDPGGVGSGLYGMLIFAIVSVFIAGLMVGRTPEYLGKKIQAAEMKLASIYLLILPLTILVAAAVAVLLPTARAAILNPGSHGLSEVVYSFVSTGNNNGSAFAGLSSNTDFYNITEAIVMAIGRFGLIIPALAIAGSLGAKATIPGGEGTFPTDTPLFSAILIGVVVLLVGLTYFPVMALGPIAEHLAGHF